MDPPEKDRQIAFGFELYLGARHPQSSALPWSHFKFVSLFLVPALSKNSGFSDIFEFGMPHLIDFVSLKTKSFAFKILRPGALKVL